MTVQPLLNGPIDPQETTEGEKFDLRGLLRIYWAFGRYYKKYWKVLTLSYLCLFATIGVTALKPWPIKLILDRVILGKHLPHRFAFLNFGASDDRTILLLVLAVSIVLISLLEALFSYVDKYLVGATGDRISADVRERVFAHLQRLSLSFHETAHSGNLVYLLVSDTRQLTKLLIDFPRDLTMRMVTFALCAGLMLALDWRLGLIALAAVPLIYLCTSYF